MKGSRWRRGEGDGRWKVRDQSDELEQKVTIVDGRPSFLVQQRSPPRNLPFKTPPQHGLHHRTSRRPIVSRETSSNRHRSVRSKGELRLLHLSFLLSFLLLLASFLENLSELVLGRKTTRRLGPMACFSSVDRRATEVRSYRLEVEAD